MSPENGVVKCVAYAGGHRVRELDIDEISDVLARPDVFVWIGLHEPDDALLKKVQQEFNLHELAVEDALRAHQRPKIERYGDCLFVVLRTAHIDDQGHLETGETHIFVGPRYVVSVRHGASLGYAPVRTRLEGDPAKLALGPGVVLYALMDFVVDHYFPVVDMMEEELETIEEEIFAERRKRGTTARIYKLRRHLLEAKRAVSPLVDVANQLMRFDLPLIPETVRPYFRDVYDHVIRVNEMIDMLRELLSTALEASLALISVAQNEAMKRLSGWAAIIAVPTMIAGIYGMNFAAMPELHWVWGYPGALGLMAVLCGYLYLRFKRAGWL